MTGIAVCSVQQWAEIYAGMGLAPIPVYGITAGRCHCGAPACLKPGKHPIGDRWNERATTNLDAVRDSFRGHRGNLGIALKGEYVLIDADGPEGMASLAAFGPLPQTLQSVSGSGEGAHLIYRLALHQRADAITDRAVAHKLDVKIRGQFVAAPSVHRSGQQYKWIRFEAPALLPDWAYEKLKKPVRPMPVASSGPTSNMFDRLRAYVAKMPAAISGSGGHNATFAVANKITHQGLTEGEEWALLCEYNHRCDPPWTESELRHKLESARAQGRATTLPDRTRAVVPPAAPTPTVAVGEPEDWMQRCLWDQGRKGPKLRKSIENAITILQFDPRWAGKIRLDSFANEVVSTNPPWDEHHRSNIEHEYWQDSDSPRLQAWFDRHHGLTLGVNDIERALAVVSERKVFSSAQDWMAGLVWDGTPRLDSWLVRYLGAEDSPYTRAVGRWWLVSIAARAHKPGCKADCAIILEGTQGKGKSTALKILTGEKWFSDTPLDLGTKDAMLALPGKLVIEMAEMTGFSRAESERAKAFFSSPTDDFRSPYARRNRRVPRVTVFAGTSNRSDYLQDSTGNRRFWPVACGAIDRVALAADREQLWAEAVAAYNEGAVWWPETEAEQAICAEVQDERLPDDPWLRICYEWLRDNLKTWTTTTELLEKGVKLPPHQMRGPEPQRQAARILASLGFASKRDRQHGPNMRYFERDAPLR